MNSESFIEIDEHEYISIKSNDAVSIETLLQTSKRKAFLYSIFEML